MVVNVQISLDKTKEVIRSSITSYTTKNDENRSNMPFWRQFWVTCGCFLANLNFGFVVGFPAIMTLDLEMNGDASYATLITSLAALTMAPGAVLGGWVMNRYGRKMAQKMVAVPLCVGFTIVAWSNYLYFICIGRLVCGLCVGMSFHPALSYIEETVNPKFKTVSMSTLFIAHSLGLLIVHLMGMFLHWSLVSYIFAVYAVSYVIVIYYVQESPVWLIQQKQIQEGRRIFKLFRGEGDEQIFELDEMIRNESCVENNSKWSLEEKSVLRPLCVLIIAFLTTELSVNNVVTFYPVQVLKQTTITFFDSNFAIIVLDIVRLVCSIIGTLLLLPIKSTRISLLAGYFFSAVALIGLALFLYISKSSNLDEFPWISALTLFFYIGITASLVKPFTWILMCQLLSTKNRDVTKLICSSFALFLTYITSLISPNMFNVLGAIVTYAAFGMCTLAGLFILCFVFLPKSGRISVQQN